jgi:predicted oxidoreductase
MNLSPIVAGTWRLNEWKLDTPGLVRWIGQVLELGITSFDHADVYGGYSVEAAFGEALAAAPALRQRLQIVTKCGIKLLSPARPSHAVKHYDTSRAHITASVENSLRALRTDRIDLLLIHRPDALMDADEVAQTFAQLRAAGKVLHFGVSNHTPSQFALLHQRLPLVTNQIEFSPLNLSALGDGTLDQAQELGAPPMVWSPLAGGRLLKAQDEQAQRVRDVLSTLGNERGVSIATMAYAWLRRHPSRPIPITGSGRIEALREAVAALEVPLSAEDWYRVWQASMNREVA